ncbi:MAG: extracellular solute-binding protein [Acidobacteriota bacterium]|nr:extracellular solute-binding protein [Acidobacteriota bacterium]
MLLVFGPFPAQAGDEVVIYSSRNEQLIKPIFEMFQKETGIEVTVRTDKAGALIQRLISEGRRTPADILLTVDAGNLWLAKSKNLLASVDSKKLETHIPDHLRDPDNQWFGFSMRARTLVYNKNKVSPSDLAGYEDLAGAAWKGKLLLRTSKKVYNQSLVAMLIAEHGEEKAEKIVSGWIANLAAPVFSNDTRLIEALASGTGSVGIVNTYYLGRLIRDNPDLPVAPYFPDASEGGTHVNVSGGALLRHAKHKDTALRLMEWLITPKAQEAFAKANLEYPVRKDIARDPIVASWGPLVQNKMNLDRAGELQARAIKLMDRVGYR